MRRTGDIAGFGGLRALAALTVLSYHVAQWGKFAPGGWLAPVLWELKGGVAIFFVISGALLYLPYARAIRDGCDLPDWRRYALRRALRILPAYWVVLTVVAVGPFSAGVFGPNLLIYYGLSQVYRPDTLFGGVGVTWSLCVEISFYALLPLFAWLAARRVARRSGRGPARAQLGLIALLALASLLLRAVLAGSPTAPITRGTTLMVSLPGLLDWFAIGMALAVLRAELEAGRARSHPLAPLGRRPGLCVLLALGLFAAAVPTQGADTFLPWYDLITHMALGLASGLLVLVAIAPAPRSGWPLRGLGHPAVAWVGSISYGVYLWHLPLLELIGPHLLPEGSSASLAQLALLWSAVVAGSLLLGAGSWYLVERPIQRLLGGRLVARNARAGHGRGPESNATVQPDPNPLNPAGVAVDHLA